jgi:hypothetical protein
MPKNKIPRHPSTLNARVRHLRNRHKIVAIRKHGRISKETNSEAIGKNQTHTSRM